MTRNKSFYAEAGTVLDSGFTAKVLLNGVELKDVTRAKSGKDGFVEFVPDSKSNKTWDYCIKNGEHPLKKLRGNVKIKLKAMRND